MARASGMLFGIRPSRLSSEDVLQDAAFPQERQQGAAALGCGPPRRAFCGALRREAGAAREQPRRVVSWLAEASSGAARSSIVIIGLSFAPPSAGSSDCSAFPAPFGAFCAGAGAGAFWPPLCPASFAPERLHDVLDLRHALRVVQHGADRGGNVVHGADLPSGGRPGLFLPAERFEELLGGGRGKQLFGASGSRSTRRSCSACGLFAFPVMFCRSPFSAALRSASGVVLSRWAASFRSACIWFSFNGVLPFSIGLPTAYARRRDSMPKHVSAAFAAERKDFMKLLVFSDSHGNPGWMQEMIAANARRTR